MVEILVQTATGTSSLASTPVTFGNNNVAGNSIIVACGNSSVTSGDVSGVTDTQGNLYVKAFTNSNASVGDLELWYTSNIKGGANTVTVAYTTGVSCAVIAREYYGTAYPISILDKQTSNTGNSSSLSSGSTGQTAQSYELLIGVGLIPLTDTFSVGAGYTNLTTLNGPAVISLGMEDQFIASSGIYSATFGANIGVQWVCGIGTFFLAPTGTTTSTSFTTSTSISSTSISSTSSSISSTSTSTSMSSTSTSYSITTVSTSSTSSSISSTSISSTSSSTSISSTSTSISSTSVSSTSISTTSLSTSVSSTSTSFSSTSSSISSTSSSVSSTSVSSTSSSSSTSTTLPPSNIDYAYQDEAPVTTILQFTPKSPSIWVCPPQVTSVLAEAWGSGGGGGGTQNAGGTGGGGGGGGGYGHSIVSVTPGTSYTVTVGVGGTAGAATPTNGGNGNVSWFSTSGTVEGAGGNGGAFGTGSTVGTGGSGGGGTGSVTYTGGSGGNSSAFGNNTGGSGGGAGGNQSTGGAGVTPASATVAGGGGGGIGGAGGQGTHNGAGLDGFPPGGGGGGGGGSSFAGGAGAGGLVQLTYTTNQNPQPDNNELINEFTNPNYGNVSVDDGDYFIETGSQYLIRQYINQHQNNTDNITFTWKGRSTVSPQASPILIQIFNVNSASWETKATQTLVPADTDFQVIITQTTNLSNYYDANNNVTFRSYQLVV